MRYNLKATKKHMIIVSTITIIICFFVYYNTILLNQKNIYHGIFIENIDISNMSKDKAREVVESKLNTFVKDGKVILKINNNEKIITLSEISFEFEIEDGLKKSFLIGRQGNVFKKIYDINCLKFRKINIELNKKYDTEKLIYILKEFNNEIGPTPSNAKVIYKDEQIYHIQESDGIIFDIDENIKIFDNAIRENNFGQIVLKGVYVPPQIKLKDIKDVNGRIGGFETKFNENLKNRVNNILLSCERINNVIVYPGEIFSLNEKLGDRTTENGYQKAKIIFQNEMVEGVGGGVCQVATTLYCAVLQSKLCVVERSHHSMPVTYVSFGLDATIAQKVIDFRFLNNKDSIIIIQAEVVGNRIKIDILGKVSTKIENVKLKSFIQETILAGTPEYFLDPSLPVGSSKIVREEINGVRVKVFRETYNERGVLIYNELISEDIYNPVKRKIVYN